MRDVRKRTCLGLALAAGAAFVLASCDGDDGGPDQRLVFVQQPTDAVAGVTMAPAIVVEIRDANGDVVASAADQVSLSCSTGTVRGTLTRTAVAGVVTFDDVSVETAGTHSLRAAAAGLAAGTSDVFSITYAAASQLAFTVQPSDALEGETITPAIVVEVQDGFGNRVTTAGEMITLSIASGSGTLGGTLTRAAVAGAATFDDITIDTSGTYTLEATCSGLAPDTSVAFKTTPAPIELTDANFDTLTSSGVVLVDFWAPWCGPCLTQAPIVDQMAEEYDGTALVGKVNVDDNPVTTAQFGITLIPTLVILKDGVEVWRAVGVQTAATLRAALDAALAM